MVGPTRRRRYLASRLFERILLIKPSSLGDIIHALPFLHAIKAHLPTARIDWLVASPFVSLLEKHPELDTVIEFDRRRYGRAGRSLAVTAEFVRFVRSLRSRRYDLVVDLQGLFRTGFLARATGARVRVGFRSAREGASIFYTDRVATSETEMHAVDRYLEVARYLGVALPEVEFKLGLSEDDMASARRLLRESDVGDGEPFVAVVPGARWETKRWPAARFSDTIDELSQEANVKCVLLGGPDEVELCNRVASACRNRPISLAGSTTLRQFAALIGRASCVLCQDSAAAHLAVALQRPLVCLVGPTNPQRTGPYRRLKDVVRVNIDCSPCYIRKMKHCPHDHRCMSELEVSTVMTAVRNALRTSVVARG